MQQVISISPFGDLAGLEHKPGQGVSLIAMAAVGGGTAKVTRASEILWNDTLQKWFVEFREGAGPYAGRLLDLDLIVELEKLTPMSEADMDTLSYTDWAAKGPGNMNLLLTFPTYDIAVAAEVCVLNHLRKVGKL